MANILTNKLTISTSKALIASTRTYFSVVVLSVYVPWIIVINLLGTYAATLPTRDLTSYYDRLIPLRPEWIWVYLLCYIYPFIPLAVVRDWHRVNKGILG